MKSYRVWKMVLAGGLFGLTGAVSAHAQVGQGLSFHRPSEKGPSARLGRIGGRYTGHTEYFDPWSAGAMRRGVPSFTSGLGPARPRGPGRLLRGQTPAPQRLGWIPSPASPTLFRRGALSDSQIGYSSGFYASIDVTTPLYGRGAFLAPQLPESSRFEVHKERSEFHEFFDVVPAASKGPAGPPLPFEDFLTAVERRTSSGVERAVEQAVRCFREATGARREDGRLVTELERPELVRQAIRQLSNARRLLTTADDPEAARDAFMLDLLIVHACLERYGAVTLQSDAALLRLKSVARHYPEAFHQIREARADPSWAQSRLNLATYYGDCQNGRSQVLERQMLHYLRSAALGTPSVGSLVLQAYCSWVLDDPARARLALDEAEKLLEDSSIHPRVAEEWRGVLAALRYGL